MPLREIDNFLNCLNRILAVKIMEQRGLEWGQHHHRVLLNRTNGDYAFLTSRL